MIVNLTRHPANTIQLAAGVVDLAGEELAQLKEALAFSDSTDNQEILDRAEFIAELACYNGLGGDEGDDPLPQQAMIDASGKLTLALARELRARSVEPVFTLETERT